MCLVKTTTNNRIKKKRNVRELDEIFTIDHEYILPLSKTKEQEIEKEKCTVRNSEEKSFSMNIHSFK